VNNLLGYRFLITNGLAFALTAALWLNGYVQPVIEGGAPLTYAIVALFAVGLVWCAKEIFVISVALNWNDANGARTAKLPDADKDVAKTEWLSSVGEWLVGLGLIGTVVGMAMALAGLPAVTDADGALKAVAHLGGGMAVAINTTLLGASLAIWHEVNCRMLKTGMAVYWADRLASDQDGGD
jgi:hypothetical protein